MKKLIKLIGLITPFILLGSNVFSMEQSNSSDSESGEFRPITPKVSPQPSPQLLNQPKYLTLSPSMDKLYNELLEAINKNFDDPDRMEYEILQTLIKNKKEKVEWKKKYRKSPLNNKYLD